MPRYRYDCQPGCPVASTLQVIAGKWKAVLIYTLLNRPVCRFHDFQNQFPDLAPRMLARQLHELENDGLITKKIYAVMPPKTEYRLTPLGQSLSPVIDALVQWGQTYNQNNPTVARH